jgi:Transglycosylase SLT domain/Peptidase family M23
VIGNFRVPPFLLPIYHAAGIEYGIRWEILAAINEIETDYGRNLNVSSAGALGWMQFIPSSWRKYGVDANEDGVKDPYNPVDAIFAAARYLKAAGYQQDVRGAIFAYNHADWYVDSVMLRARLIAGVPADLVGSLTGLTEGRPPVAARARYTQGDRRGIDIFARQGSPVVAVNDGVIKKIGRSRRLGRYIVLQDAYGNRYTYAKLGRIARNSGLKRLEEGMRVVGGTILARVGAPHGHKDSHLYFEIRPAGPGAPRIDPKPILDGWYLLARTKIYRPSGENVLHGEGISIGQILLLPKPMLQRHVLNDNRIDIYPCGREDIRSGQVDRRVLATLAYLAESGLRPTVTALKCGHSFYTSSGSVSHHSSGNAVDIAQVNGVPILGHQGRGGITDRTVKRLLTLQGTLAADQIISLLDLGGPTVSMADHADHIHVGFRPLFEPGRKLGEQALAVLQPGQWSKLLQQLGSIDNPVVPIRPSPHAIPVKKRRSGLVGPHIWRSSI